MSNKMESLNFDDGLKTLAINGDENRTIKINPTDTNVLSRYIETSKYIDELSSKYECVGNDISKEEKAKILADLDKEARGQLDYIIGSDVSGVVFGTANCLSPSGGKSIFENFIDSYMSYMKPVIKSEYEKSRKRVKKYVNQAKDFE